MKVYIEFVILDNLVIDYIVLYAAAMTVRLSVKWYRLLPSAIIGTTVAVLFPLMGAVQIWAALLIKAGVSAVMTLIPAGFHLKKYLLSLLFFYLYTFVIGGVCYGLLSLFTDVDFSSGGLTYESKVPIGLPLLAAFLAYIAIAAMLAYLKAKKRIQEISCEIEIILGEKHVKLPAIIDTGNLLRDPESGDPVAVVSGSTLYELITDDDGKSDIDVLPMRHYADYETAASGKSKILLFKPDKFLLYYGDKAHIISNIMVGITKGVKSFQNGVMALMPLTE